MAFFCVGSRTFYIFFRFEEHLYTNFAYDELAEKKNGFVHSLSQSLYTSPTLVLLVKVFVDGGGYRCRVYVVLAWPISLEPIQSGRNPTPIHPKRIENLRPIRLQFPSETKIDVFSQSKGQQCTILDILRQLSNKLQLPEGSEHRLRLLGVGNGEINAVIDMEEEAQRVSEELLCMYIRK